MKSKRLYVIALLWFPLLASASGQDVLDTILIQFVFFLLSLVAVLSLRATLEEKVLLLWVYLVSVVVTSFFTWNLPHRENTSLIDVLNVAVPSLTITICFIGLRLRKK